MDLVCLLTPAGDSSRQICRIVAVALENTVGRDWNLGQIIQWTGIVPAVKSEGNLDLRSLVFPGVYCYS